MTWRRFLVLIRGLSTQSAAITAYNARQEFGNKGERVNTVEGPKATQAAFTALFGGAKAKRQD